MVKRAPFIRNQEGLVSVYKFGKWLNRFALALRGF